MESAGHGPHGLGEPGLDVHVDIFQGGVEGELARFDFDGDLLQPRHQGIRIPIGDQARAAQHAGMGDGSPDVIAGQGLVEVDGCAEALHCGIGGFREASPPQFRRFALARIGFFSHVFCPRSR